MSKPGRAQYDAILAIIQNEMWQDTTKFEEILAHLDSIRSFDERYAKLASIANQGFKRIEMTNYQMVAMYNTVKDAVRTGQPDMETLAAVVRDVEAYRSYLAEQANKQKNIQ